MAAETSAAQRNVRALTETLALQEGRLATLRASYDAGNVTADKFVRQQAAIERQIAKTNAQLKDAGSAGSSAQSALSGFANFLSNRLVFTLGDVANAARTAFQEIREGAQRVAQEDALRRQIDHYDEFIAKLQEVSKGTIAQADLIASSSKAILLGIPAEEIAGLLEIARGAAVALGTDVTQAFNDIVTGIGRGSPLILDNLGLVVKLESAMSKAAAESGTTVEALTTEQRTRALLNEVLDQNLEKYRQISGSQTEVVTALDRGTAALNNAKDGAIQFGTSLAQLAAGGISATIVGIELLAEAGIKLARGFVFIGQQIPIVGSAFDGAAATLKRLDDEIDVSQRKFAQYAVDLSLGGAAGLGFAETQEKAAKAIRTVSDAADSAGPTIVVHGEAAAAAATAVDEFATSQDDATAATNTLAEAATKSVDAFVAISNQVRASTRDFDALAASIGRAAAAQQLVEQGGATLSSDGRRINLRGGSRLTTPAGFGSSVRESRLFPGMTTII